MRFPRFLVVGFVLAGLAAGQDPASLFDQAPPDVDQALRARVSAFYKAFMDGKYREAYNLVSPNDSHSQDVFFGMDKNQYTSFNIVKITYEDNFSKARVLSDCGWEMFMLPEGKMPVHYPLASTWRMEDGKWWWYAIPIDRTKGQDTPFGNMKPGEGDGTPEDIQAKILAGPKPEDFRSMVKVDRNLVSLEDKDGAAVEVTFTSSFNGPLQLVVDGQPAPGLDWKLDSAEVPPNGTARLRFNYTAGKTDKSTDVVLLVQAEPIGQVIPIKVRFGPLPPAAFAGHASDAPAAPPAEAAPAPPKQ